MVKKIIFLSSLLFFATTLVHANGFYTGFGLGNDSARFHKILKIAELNGREVYYKNDNLSGTGFNLTGVVGYQWEGQRMALATELSAQASSLKYHGYVDDNYTNQEISHADFTLNQSYGVSFLPGYIINHAITLYGRLEVEKGKFNYAEHKRAPSYFNGISETKWLNGLRYGVGMKVALTKKWQLRLEYDQVAYQRYVDNTYPLAPNVTRTIKITPTSNQGLVMLVYLFGGR